MNKSHRELVADAWVKLGVTPEQVSAVPQVSGVLKSAGGRAKILGYLRSSNEPDARKVLNIIDGVEGNSLKKLWMDSAIPMEAFCVSADIPTRRLLELVAGEVFLRSGQEAGLLAAAAHPKIVKKSIQKALEEPVSVKQPDGTVKMEPAESGLADRRMLHQHAQFLPMPKTQFINMPHGTIDNRQQTQVNVAVAPPVEETVKRLSDRFNAHASAMPVLEAVEVDEEEDEEDEG